MVLILILSVIIFYTSNKCPLTWITVYLLFCMLWMIYTLLCVINVLYALNDLHITMCDQCAVCSEWSTHYYVWSMCCILWMIYTLLCDQCVCLTPPVTEYVESMETKIKPLLVKKQLLSEAQMQKFGKKDPEAYPLYVQCHYTGRTIL